MDCSLYLRRGIVYVPTAYLTEAGFYLIREPIAVVPLEDTQSLHEAIRETAARGNPQVPTPSREEFRTPAVLKYAGVKSLRTFERTAMMWAISERDGIYKIIGYRKSPYGGWEEDRKQDVVFPPGTSLDSVIDRMIEILQAAVPMMNCRVYLRNDTVYLPTFGLDGNGVYRSVEPVEVVAVGNRGGLRKALEQTISRGNPPVPVLAREEHPTPLLLKMPRSEAGAHLCARP